MTPSEMMISDLGPIRSRIRHVRKEYEQTLPDRNWHGLLRTFSDLAQEYETIEDFYRLCVALPREYLQLESRFLLTGETDGTLELVCDSCRGLIFDRQPTPAPAAAAPGPCRLADSSYLFPIHHRQPMAEERLEKTAENLLLGALELSPLAAELTEDERFFISRYTRLIGYHLHSRLLAQQNLRHLRFINSLVMDIEHNVIVPNMYFKHIFNQLTRKIKELQPLRTNILSLEQSHGVSGESCRAAVEQIETLHRDLMKYDEELRRHHAATSLFLESLFRRDHFERGRFVLRPRTCFVEKEIILPQLEHYKRRLQRRRVAIERPSDMLEEEIPLMVDVGLLSQVYANLFSNAVKYTEEVTDHRGLPRKAMSYGREIISNYFGLGQGAIKFNVFTTGRHLPPAEADSIFADGYRRKESKRKPGTGHGLSFLKHVIEVHGGRVGYEPTPEGNNFYFVLPLPLTEGKTTL
ncbi:MAG: ATP-binding protein [Deltaproteobacteria bacterium]